MSKKAKQNYLQRKQSRYIPTYLKPNYKPKYSEEDIKNLKGLDINKMNKNQAYNYAKDAAYYAIERRKKFSEDMANSDIQTNPIAYGEHSRKLTPEEQVYNSYENFDFEVRKRYMDLNTLKFQLKMSRNYLQTKTSTFEGWENFMQDFASRVQNKSAMLISKEEFTQYWNGINRFIDAHPMYNQLFSSSQLQKITYDLVESYKQTNTEISATDIYKKLTKLYDIVYKDESKKDKVIENPYGYTKSNRNTAKSRKPRKR